MWDAEIYLGLFVALISTTCRRSAFLRLVGHDCDEICEKVVMDDGVFLWMHFPKSASDVKCQAIQRKKS
jgi:hypothetical protein